MKNNTFYQLNACSPDESRKLRTISYLSYFGIHANVSSRPVRPVSE